VFPVDSVVTHAGFANSKSVSAVFVKCSRAAALFLGDQLLNLVQLGRHGGEEY
jgi:hypothetical protein